MSFITFSLTFLSVVSIRSCTVNNKAIDYILISRRSVYRAGTRFYMRGLDSEGQAANFVETEQILLYDGHKCSLVQVNNFYISNHQLFFFLTLKTILFYFYNLEKINALLFSMERKVFLKVSLISFSVL